MKLAGAGLLAALLALTPLEAKPIDRIALVKRHNIDLTRIDPHAPLMLGNGALGFVLAGNPRRPVRRSGQAFAM